MINPREIMIGNWLMFEQIDGKKWPVQIDIITVTGDPYNGWDGFSAIPLTHDILEKCGFKKTFGTNFYTIQLPLNIAVLSINPSNGMVWLRKLDNILNPIGGIYLHQLQNLYYALTGEELIYKP